MRTIAIIQARLGSTRFPRKVLAPMPDGRPIIAHVVERAKKIKGVDVVTIAAPYRDAATFADLGLGVIVHPGPEEDVLERFRLTATCKVERADVVVRITADCPLLNVGLGSLVVHALRGHDYATCRSELTDGWDVEAMTIEELLIAAAHAESPYDREHVTPFMYQSDIVHVNGEAIPNGEKWSVDTPEDLELVRKRFAEGW